MIITITSIYIHFNVKTLITDQESPEEMYDKLNKDSTI